MNRLLSKLLMSIDLVKLKPSLSHQYGIKESSAIHSIPNAIRTFVNASPTSLVLQVDIANVFGSVSRHALLNALKAHQDTSRHHSPHQPLQFDQPNLQQDLTVPRRLNTSVQWHSAVGSSFVSFLCARPLACPESCSCCPEEWPSLRVCRRRDLYWSR
jgi:hypothetical protein